MHGNFQRMHTNCVSIYTLLWLNKLDMAGENQAVKQEAYKSYINIKSSLYKTIPKMIFKDS